MKTFEALAFDPARCRKEVGELRAWLARRPVLDEAKHLRPFFRKRRHLSAFIASYSPDIVRFDRLAFEYPLFGDFNADLAVGDSVKHAYCFVEFEDAGPGSLFVQQGKKATREWSARLDHGYGQIIDWFAKLDDSGSRTPSPAGSGPAPFGIPGSSSSGGTGTCFPASASAWSGEGTMSLSPRRKSTC
jgi:hypothetical protein